MKAFVDVVLCQKLCQLVLGFQHFTFHWRGETLGNCYLKGNLGLTSLPDATSSSGDQHFASLKNIMPSPCFNLKALVDLERNCSAARVIGVEYAKNQDYGPRKDIYY